MKILLYGFTKGKSINGHILRLVKNSLESNGGILKAIQFIKLNVQAKRDRKKYNEMHSALDEIFYF